MDNNKFFNILNDGNLEIIKKISLGFFKNKIITITGGSGLVGSHLVSFFYSLTKSKNRPKKIYVIHKSTIPNYLNFLKKNKFFIFLKIDLVVSKKQLPKSDIIIHSAGYAQPSKFIEYAEETLLLNSRVTQELLLKLKKNGKFLFISSSEIYSGLIGNVTEERVGNTNTSHKRACYIEGKRFGETLINIYRNKKIDAKSIRLCLAYGPGVKIDDKRVMSEFIESAISKQHITLQDDGSSVRSYIFIKDAIYMIMNILLLGKSNIYNLGGKRKITIKDLAKNIAKIFNIKISARKIKKNNSAPKSAFVSIKKYEDEFGKIKLTNINDGLIKTIKWHQLLNKNL